MSGTSVAAGQAGATAALRAFGGAVERSLLGLARTPAVLVAAFVIPAVMLIAFLLVFGHAAAAAGIDYALFVLAAVMFQAVLFAAGGSAMAFALDAEQGLLDRQRTLPVAAWAVVCGRLAGDVLRCVASIVAVVAVALLAGARPASFGALAAAAAIALVAGIALALLFAGVALRARHPVQAAGLVQAVEMPLLMLSTAFIPLATLPGWLRPIVAHLPFSPIIDTVRALLHGTPPGAAGWQAAAWLGAGAAIGLAFVIAAFRRRA